MFIYTITLFLTVTLLSISSKSIQLRNRKKMSTLLCGFPMFLVAALRSGIGTDYGNYIEMYELYFSHGFQGKVEPAFYHLNVLIYKVLNHPQWIFAICSAITIFLIFYYILEASNNYVFSVYIYMTLTFYLSSFNTMRQHVACAICMIALLFLKKKNIF